MAILNPVQDTHQNIPGPRLDVAQPRLVQRVVQAAEDGLRIHAGRRLRGEGGGYAVAPHPQRVQPGRQRCVEERPHELRR